MVACTLFHLVFDEGRREFSVFGVLHKIDLGELRVIGSRRCIADVVCVILVAAAAVHHVLIPRFFEPERTLNGVPVAAVALAVSHEDLLVEIGHDDLAAKVRRCERIEKFIDKNAGAEAFDLSVILRIEEEESLFGLDHVRVDREAVKKSGLPSVRPKRRIGFCHMQPLEHILVSAGKIEIIFSVCLYNARCPEFSAALNRADDALEVPFTEKIIRRIGLHAVERGNKHIESAVVLEDVRIGLCPVFYIEFEFHILFPFPLQKYRITQKIGCQRVFSRFFRIS